MSSTNEKTTGVNRVLEKLRNSLAAGNYYEAHQMYRTLYFRYCAQKKFGDLVHLLVDGSSKLLDYNQIASGYDLANLFVDVLQKWNRNVDEHILEYVEEIFSRLVRLTTDVDNDSSSASALPSAADRDAFVMNLIKWTKQVSPVHKFGHPRLHKRLATIWWNAKNYQQAQYHFVLSDDGEGCASFLVEYHLAKGYPSEVDLFIAQTVFQYLCHKDKSTASVVFFKYTQCHPNVKGVDCESGPPFYLPLLNFVWLLLLCIDTGRITFFTGLVEQYQPCIKRDPSYLDYLDRIGQLFFGLPPPKKPTTKGGLWQSLVKGLLGESSNDQGDDDDDSSSDELLESAPSTPTSPEVLRSGNTSASASAAKAMSFAEEDLD